jgi:hypothetical protein
MGICLGLISIKGTLSRLAAYGSGGIDQMDSEAGWGEATASGPKSGLELRSLADAKSKRATIAESDADGTAVPQYPQQLATVLADLDQWLVRKDDIDAFQQYKLELAGELRTAIENSVNRLHAECLQASDSAAAQPAYGEAGQLIALFPLADDPAILKRASELSTTHSMTAARLEAIRRQRYNLWALERIGRLLTWLEKEASSWTRKDNPQVVTRAALDLGVVDPSLLEPAAMQLYSLALSKSNEAISTGQQADLAKKLTNPALKTRRTLGDF